MDARQERGLEMADRFKISRNGDGWVVPSATGNGRYRVHLNDEFESCTCPDFEQRGSRCKHLFAVQVVIQRELKFDGNGTVTETETVQVTQTVRKTYQQDWKAYNRSQTSEQDRFQELVHELCDGIDEPEQKMGRPRMPIRDVVFAMLLKVYGTMSGRRSASDIREAKKRGHIERVPAYNTVFKYLEKPELTPLLRELVIETARPLSQIEEDFACDSSGFSAFKFERWFDFKYGQPRQRQSWVKVHVMCGVKTNVVTSVEIRDRDASDTKLLPDLVNATAKSFTLREVSADKVYASMKNYSVIESHGATPYIVFKSSHTGRDKNRASGGLWARMFHYFSFRREEFLSHYHKRSNVESCFSMMKRKFGDFVRSKTDTAMANEVLCKIVCHNICCLIQESNELGIAPTLWAEHELAHKVTA